MFTIPMAHLRGIPDALRERYGIPIVFYDGDVPMSLPEYGGMDTGFNPYHGADPWEYDLVLSNSEGGIGRLLELGARRAEALYWGADPEFFAPQDVEKEVDVFFYGYGDKFRRDWMKTMVGEPSRRAPELDIALGGLDFQGDTGSARMLGDVPFNAFARAISAARVNLNMTRRPHATIPGSSTARPFELASSGAAIVSNPHDGIERWFEPGSELVVVETPEAAVDAYRELVADPAQAEEMGRRARERVLDEHTYAHRARRLLAARRSRRPGLGVSSRVSSRSSRRGTRREPSAGRRRDQKASTAASRSSSSTTRLATTPPRSPRRTGRRSSGFRSTSASGARCRPGSGTRSRRATSERFDSTATASTTPRRSRRSSHRSRPARPTS